jgi:hypothetical protein
MVTSKAVQVGLDMSRLTEQLDIIAKHAKACADELRALAAAAELPPAEPAEQATS